MVRPQRVWPLLLRHKPAAALCYYAPLGLLATAPLLACVGRGEEGEDEVGRGRGRYGYGLAPWKEEASLSTRRCPLAPLQSRRPSAGALFLAVCVWTDCRYNSHRRASSRNGRRRKGCTIITDEVVMVWLWQQRLTLHVHTPEEG